MIMKQLDIHDIYSSGKSLEKKSLADADENMVYFRWINAGKVTVIKLYGTQEIMSVKN